jgi:alpha-aminoadipate carrier protein LysW
MITCPVCDAAIDVEEDELDEGEIFSCDECGADLKVLGVDPLELEPVEEDEEDEEEDEDEAGIEEDDEEEEDEENWR